MRTKEGEQSTVTVRITKETHQGVRLLAAMWYVSQQEAMARAVEEALAKEALAKETKQVGEKKR